MPYGLFDYGGTIQTMGAVADSPTVILPDYVRQYMNLSSGDQVLSVSDPVKLFADAKRWYEGTGNPTTDMLGEDSKTPVYTRAIPEDPNVVKVRADDLPPVGTAAYPEDPSTPVTRAFPEDPNVVKVRADDAPPSGGCPKGYEPTSQNQPDGKQFYPANPYTLAIPE